MEFDEQIDEIIDDIIRKVDVNAQRHLCINYLQGQLDDLGTRTQCNTSILNESKFNEC